MLWGPRSGWGMFSFFFFFLRLNLLYQFFSVMKQWKEGISGNETENTSEKIPHFNLFLKSCKTDIGDWSLKRFFLSLLSLYVPLFQTKPSFHSLCSNLKIGKILVTNKVLSVLLEHSLMEFCLLFIDSFQRFSILAEKKYVTKVHKEKILGSWNFTAQFC